MSEVVRTRFAPSPTGFMHIGGIRTALFAWAYARNRNGRFVLRIEDTDKEREVAGALEHIQESLRWLELDWDEGPGSQDQSFGPYIQSERLEIYHQWAQKLIDGGIAYADPYTTEELDIKRRQVQAQNRPFLYREFRPVIQPPDSGWYGHQPIRFLNTYTTEPTTWHDEVRGEMHAGTEAQDDFIIIKADGYPTYNFAHVIDDHLMEISHVMRGEEFIASTPKFIALHQALQIPIPKMATLPPILSITGGKKLSKRDGAKDVLAYRQEGYLPEALINFLASLGWNDGTEDEIFTPQEIVAKFSLDRIQRAGARFDQQKLDWISGHHIRNLDLPDLYDKIDASFWPAEATGYSRDYQLAVLGLVHERLKRFQELNDLTIFFFVDPQLEKTQIIGDFEPVTVSELIAKVITALEASDFSDADLEIKLRQLATDASVKTSDLFKIIRHAITGRKDAPGLFETLSTLGRDISLRRMVTAQSLLAD